ncbi:exported hypothetical protein [Candidatus Zixiibacteriota bacterium]|nr:exported hypothetical protein [candidate division Zixibacteria bacterium]
MSPKKKSLILGFLLMAVLAVLLVTTQLSGIKTTAPGGDAALYAADSAVASQTSTVTDSGVVEKESMLWPLVKLVGALTLVVGCIYGFLYLLKRMMGAKLSSNREHRLLEVLETTYISQKKSVALIRVAERSVLVGITEENITPLTELDKDETTQMLGDLAPEKRPVGFKSLLREARGKFSSFNARKIKSTELTDEIKSPQTV